METLEELDWCLDQLESMQTHRSVSDMASNKVTVLRDFVTYLIFYYFEIAVVNQCPLIIFVKALSLWLIQSKQNFVWENGQVLAALAGRKFQVQF